MTSSISTIIALSSGSLPSGIAVIRISGPETQSVLQQHGIKEINPRAAKLSGIRHAVTGELLDRGIVLWFPEPTSFTGENCAELHVHGGNAVVQSVIDSLLQCHNVRLADAGEFSRRAFENGKLDLTEIEGLSDLLSAQTEAQRKQALNQGEGSLRSLCENWRERLIGIQAQLAADIDFVDEDDVPEDLVDQSQGVIADLNLEISAHLDDGHAGEIIRDGFRVVIMGPPNAGKSSLLNVLAKRDVAIVTNEAGTTRDVLDVHLDIGGFEVIVSDTAGIRETDSIVEEEGIRRAQARGEAADLVIWLSDIADAEKITENSLHQNSLSLVTKDDSGKMKEGKSISCKTGHGMDWLLEELSNRVQKRLSKSESGLVSRVRHRTLLEECSQLLGQSLEFSPEDVDLKAEVLRHAGDCLGKLTGRIDVEDLLDVIFSEFCVGK